MKTVEIAVTAIYFAACVAIAWASARKAGSSASYWAADHAIGVWVNGFGTFSTLVSAASFLGFLGMTCRWGWSLTAVALGVGPTLGFVLSMLLVSGPLRRYSERRRKFTLSNFLSDRFGPATGTAGTVLVILIFSSYIVPQLIGGGLVAEYVLGIERRLAILLVGAVFIAYVLAGGMLSVTWTDFMQGILMFALMVGLAAVAFLHFGGPGPLVASAVEVRPHFLDLDPKLSWWTYLGLPLGITVFVLSAPHTIMRLFTAKDVRQGRLALSLCAGLCLVFHLVGYLGVAAGALALRPDLAQYDQTYVVAMNELFPAVGRGLGVAAILAAIMSTTAGLLLTAGAEFSINIYRRFLRPGANDAEGIRAGRWAMLAIGVGATALALVETRGIGVIVGQLVTAVGSAFAVPLVAGIWWKRATPAGGILGLLGGFVAFLAAHYSGLVGVFGEILVSLPASIAGMVLGSLLGRPATPQQEELVDTLHRSAPAPRDPVDAPILR
jgi:sodium/pantothenate symporter